jgi:hypothetical protein
MTDSYILEGIESEYLLVVKTEDVNTILAIIDRLGTSRLKYIKDLAAELEKSLHDDGSRRNSSKIGPKDKAKSTTSNKGRRTKAANPKYRSKPRS